MGAAVVMVGLFGRGCAFVHPRGINFGLEEPWCLASVRVSRDRSDGGAGAVAWTLGLMLETFSLLTDGLCSDIWRGGW